MEKGGRRTSHSQKRQFSERGWRGKRDGKGRGINGRGGGRGNGEEGIGEGMVRKKWIRREAEGGGGFCLG